METLSIWLVVVVVAILVVALISGLFQPSGLVISYEADSYFQVRKLFFAAGVLAVLAFMLLLSIAVYMSMSLAQPPAGQAGKEIFDSMIKVIPPIMTLVLGYYFGQQTLVKQGSNPGANLPPPKATESVKDGKGGELAK